MECAIMKPLKPGKKPAGLLWRSPRTPEQRKQNLHAISADSCVICIRDLGPLITPKIAHNNLAAFTYGPCARDFRRHKIPLKSARPVLFGGGCATRCDDRIEPME